MHHRNILKEPNHTPSDPTNVFARKPPASAGLPNAEISPREQMSSSLKQDAKILCKRIDNTAHTVNVKADQTANQKFVPLAFPLENLKRKSGQPSLTRAEGVGQPEKKYVQSMPQSVAHSRPETRPQSMPVSQNTSLTFNPEEFYRHEVKEFKRQKVPQSYEQEAYRASIEHGRGLMDKLLSSPGKTQKKSALPIKRKTPSLGLKKPSISDKSPRKDVLTSIKEKREMGKLSGGGPMQRSMKDLREEDSAGKGRNRQFEYNNRMVKSGKNSKASSPVRVEPVAQKKTMRKVKKREHVSKSEVPAAIEEMIQKNANEYIEGLKAKKHVSELEKKVKDERKMMLEEGNKMIRVANMQRFNQTGATAKPPAKMAWGADQRKLQQPTYSKHEEPGHQRSKSKVEDQDRRRILGLEHLDEEKIRQLQRKALQEQRQREKLQEYTDKPKKVLGSAEKMRLKEYMDQKKARMEHELYRKDYQAHEDLERKRKNLEKLFGVIQDTKDRDQKKPKSAAMKKKPKKKKGELDRSPRPQKSKRKNLDDIMAERNSNAYYREYMNIIGSRQAAEEARLRQMSERYPGKKSEYTDESEEQRRQRIRQLEEYSANLQKGKKSSGRGKGHYDYDRREAQEVMMKMDTHSFSDDDDIKSNRMIIGERKSDSGNAPPEDSVREIMEAREIIEAAVIFIQKNYRGYRTRKLLAMFFDQLYQDEMERMEHENGEYYQEEDLTDEGNRQRRKIGTGEEEEERKYGDSDEEQEYKDKKNVVQMLENRQKEKFEDFDEDEDVDEQEYGQEEEEDIEQQELDKEEEYYNEQQRLKEQYNLRQAQEKQTSQKQELQHMQEYLETSEPSKFSEKSGARAVDDYLRGQKAVGASDKKEVVQKPAPQPEYAYEDQEDEDFGEIQVLRRAKSDGELLADRQFGTEDDLEDSNQISFHDDDEQSYRERAGLAQRGGYAQGYLQGVNAKGGMLSMDSDRSKNAEDEYLDEEHRYQPGSQSERDYDDRYSQSLGQSQSYMLKVPQEPRNFSNLGKVPTVNSVTVPTKNMLESHVNPSANTSKDLIIKRIRTAEVDAHSEELEPTDVRIQAHLEQSKNESRVPRGFEVSDIPKEIGNNSKSLVTISDFAEEEKLMGLSNPLETGESPEKSAVVMEKKNVREESAGKREEDMKEEATQTSLITPTGLRQSEEGLSLPTGVRSSVTQNEKVLLQKTFELSTHYQNELIRLREEQAKKWSEVISQLEVLQTQGDVDLNQKVKNFVENLSKQSELNKKMLIDNMEMHNLVKTQSGLSERSLMTEVETLLKQKPEEAKNITDRSQPSVKKVESPANSESKFQKKKKLMDFAKKTNLEIDVTAEEQEAAAGMNLDLSQMRLALGSEQLVRQQSARTLSQSIGTPTEPEFIDLQTPDNAEGVTSIFERDPFQEFTHKKLRDLMSKDSMQKIFKMREDALELRHKSQMDSMKKMLETHKFSPRTFQNKAIELEKWVSKERENIQRSKKHIERGWLSTAESLKRTQRDLQFLQKRNGHNTEGRHSTMSDLSIRHSFADEDHLERTDNGETSIDKHSVRSSIPRQQLGAEVISPTASKNIKIVDKFELYDTPEARKESIEERKTTEEKEKDVISKFQAHKEESTKQVTEDREPEPSVDISRGTSGKSPERGFSPETRKRDTTPVSYKNLSHLASSDKTNSFRHLEHEQITEGDFEVGLAGITEKDIDWQSEARASVPVLPSKTEYKVTTMTADPASQARLSRSQIPSVDGPENRSGSSATLTPKGNQDIRSMIQEQFENGKLVDIVHKDQDTSSYKEESIEIRRLMPGQKVHTEEDQLQEEISQELSVNKKTDLITEEVLKALIEEFGQEFIANASKEHILEKAKEMQEGLAENALQNMIENNYFFTGGSEKHPGFEANIAMPPSEVVDVIAERHAYEEIGHRKHDAGDITQEEVSKQESEREYTEEEQEHEVMVKKEEDESEVMPDTIDEDQVQHTESQAELYRVLGIKTDMKAVEHYLDILIDEIKGGYMEFFIRNINVPIGLSVTEKLNNMHAYDPNNSESSLEMSAGLQQAILSIQLYLDIERKIMEENPTKNEVSIELEHIHNKMIFDCLNEVLDSHRPYGLIGEPYPWKSTIKATQPVPVTRDNIDKVLQRAKKKVLNWATYICGYYGEKDEFIQDRTQSFVEEYLAQTKEEKLSKMLAAEIHEAEDKWLAYDDEESEVQLEIADLIFDKLVTEAAEFITQISNQRRGIKPRPQFEAPKFEEKKLKRKGSL